MKIYLNYPLEIGMVMLLANQNAIFKSTISQKQIDELISFLHADANSENWRCNIKIFVWQSISQKFWEGDALEELRKI